MCYRLSISCHYFPIKGTPLGDIDLFLIKTNIIYFTIIDNYTIPKHYFFKGPKYYNNVMINNLLIFKNVYKIYKLKKVIKKYF